MNLAGILGQIPQGAQDPYAQMQGMPPEGMGGMPMQENASTISATADAAATDAAGRPVNGASFRSNPSSLHGWC